MESVFVMSAWHWLAIALVLGTLEIMVPGAFLLWLGLAAAVTGLLKAIVPGLGLDYQLLIFAAFSVLFVAIALLFFRRRLTHTGRDLLNQRGSQMVGMVTTLEEGLENGRGRAQFGDTIWAVEGDDLIAGTKVRVVSVDGNRLRIEKA